MKVLDVARGIALGGALTGLVATGLWVIRPDQNDQVPREGDAFTTVQGPGDRREVIHLGARLTAESYASIKDAARAAKATGDPGIHAITHFRDFGWFGDSVGYQVFKVDTGERSTTSIWSLQGARPHVLEQGGAVYMDDGARDSSGKFHQFRRDYSV